MSRKSAINGSNRSVLTKKQQDGEIPCGSQEMEKVFESKKRKLHKTYIKAWNEDIAKNGFARCIIASCNFVSSDISTMQKHHKTCLGVYSCDNNLYEKGDNAANDEVLCQSNEEQKRSRKGVNITDERLKKWEHQIKTLGQAYCGVQECNFVGMKISDMEEHSRSCNGVPNFSLFCCIHCRCGFLSKEDHLKHQQNCCVPVKLGPNSKKVENLHFRFIKQMKNKDSSEDHIIQPGPDLPKGQYRRRRAYRAEHKNSWAITLEKFKYVKCIYQNCYFIAMSLEDMISHFGYCNGDGSFAKFICPYCNGRVTSEAVLSKHIERSHPMENSSIKDGCLENENNEELLKSESQYSEGKNSEINQKTGQTACRKIWEDQISEFGYAFCRKSLCNFMAANVTDLEIHLRTCDGTPDFEMFNCQKCRYRLPSEEDLTRHVPFCNDEKIKYFSTFGSEVTKSQTETIEEDNFEIGPVVRQYGGKNPKIHTKKDKINSATSDVSENNSNESTQEEKINENVNLKDTKQKSRGRPRKSKEVIAKPEKAQIKCGKCDFKGSKTGFVSHNMRTHVGLAWIEGEEPVDLNDEKLVIRLVKEAFRLNKKGTCENCGVVKRSVMGFVTHIQICGKSSEEINAFKIQCPHCEGKYMKYSFSTHLKVSHPSPEEVEEEKSEVVEVEEVDTSGKRRSAIKAVSKFQEVLNENDEPESNQTHYVVFEKGSEKVPKLNSKLSNLWYKLRRENKKIPCRHPKCKTFSNDVKEARNHHYNCPSLPQKVYMCEMCDFYSVEESDVQSHVTTHRRYLKHKITKGEEEVKLDEELTKNEEDGDEEEDSTEEQEEEEPISSEGEAYESDEPKKRKKKSNDKSRKKAKLSNDTLKSDLDIEFRLKQNFCKRENIENVRGLQFYSKALEMTLEEEMSSLGSSDIWPEFHTALEDWTQVPPSQVAEFLPELEESVSVRFGKNENNWRRFKRFDGDLIDGVPVMFTGGSVRCMSWCKISFKRMLEKTQKQYLAVVTSKKFDHLKNIYDRSSIDKSTLLQIWNCGALVNDLAENVPEFSLGLVQNGGEIWDLAWFPNDTFAEGSEERLTRLGLLATSSEDGAVRVWSICDPSQLETTKGLPVYITDPIAILKTDEDVEESCLKLSISSDGILAGGYSNGTVALWNLKNISSPFCKKLGKCKIIRAHLVFQAHKTTITALTFCPSNSRYVSTAGLDRFVKIWDSESPSVPVEHYNKDYSLDNIWTMNWPVLIFNFDDIMINFNKGAMKYVKDILTERHQSTLVMEDTCLSLSFSDWLNALCAGSITGEVKVRCLKSLFHDQKKFQSTLSSVRLEKLKQNEDKKDKETVEKDLLRNYEDVALKFGLVFKDRMEVDKKKPQKPEIHPEEFPIRAVNKIVFNPNFKSFTHIAMGYNCGLIRIPQLRELQSTISLKLFIEKTERKNS